MSLEEINKFVFVYCKLNNCYEPNSGKPITDLPLFFYPKAEKQVINKISLSHTVSTEFVANT